MKHKHISIKIRTIKYGKRKVGSAIKGLTLQLIEIHINKICMFLIGHCFFELESYNVTHTCKFEKDEDANKDENFEYLN
jgi:hypothetical protein